MDSSPPAPLSDDEITDLARVAFAAAALAHAPYSKLRIGAALLGDSGQVYTGCNVENASYGLTICAERVALFKAVSSGETSFRAVVIATSKERAMMPCGACRQVLHEFAPELTVITQGMGSERVETTLPQLLPGAFSPTDLD